MIPDQFPNRDADPFNVDLNKKNVKVDVGIKKLANDIENNLSEYIDLPNHIKTSKNNRFDKLLKHTSNNTSEYQTSNSYHKLIKSLKDCQKNATHWSKVQHNLSSLSRNKIKVDYKIIRLQYNNIINNM